MSLSLSLAFSLAVVSCQSHTSENNCLSSQVGVECLCSRSVQTEGEREWGVKKEIRRIIYVWYKDSESEGTYMCAYICMHAVSGDVCLCVCVFFPLL